MNQLLTIAEVSEILRIEKDTVRKWAREGKIPSVIINKRGDRRFRPEDVEKISKIKQ